MPPTSLPSPQVRLHKSRPSREPQPWHAYLTLDLLLHVLSRTLFHPFLAALLPLCLRALAAPYNSTSFILTCAFATSVSLFRILESFNARIAFGKPREVNWEDEVVVVTGGVGGLGGCIAEILALRGIAVAVLDISVPEPMYRPVGKSFEKEGVLYYRCDLRDRQQIESTWAGIVASLGTPTVLINNAAVTNGGPSLSQHVGKIEDTFRVNFLAQTKLNSLFLAPSILNRPAGATIVTISSVLGHLGTRNLTAYTASKAALIAYHHSLTAELSIVSPQIKTILATPGQLDTQLFGNVKLRGFWRNFFGPVVSAGDIAVKIVEMLDRGEGGVVCEPAYARWIAVLDLLPMGVKRVVRGWSGIDEAFAVPLESDEEEGGDGGDDSGGGGRKYEG